MRQQKERNMAKIGIVDFFKQVRSEMRKITWPTRQETTVSTIAVFIMAVVASLFLYFADQLIALVMRVIMGFGF